MLHFLRRFDPVSIAILAALLAVLPWPMAAEPHLVEKLKMLSAGELTKPLDIFDLFWHSFLFVVLAVRLYIGDAPTVENDRKDKQDRPQEERE